MRVGLCHQHGFCEDEVETKAADRHGSWFRLLEQRYRQAVFEDYNRSHQNQNVVPNPSLVPWSRPAGRRAFSPAAHAQRIEQQRQHRAAEFCRLSVLQRPYSGRALLNKLSALVRATEGGHLLLDSGEDRSPKPAKVAKLQEKAQVGMRSILTHR